MHSLRGFLYGVLLLLLCVCALGADAKEQAPLKSKYNTASRNVAIIGAGSAGASTAYYLRKFAELSGVPPNITVFERETYIGGRSTTVDVFDNPSYPVELGASIFVSINHNLMDAAKELGLKISSAGGDRPKDSDKMLGIWDGDSFVYTQGHSLSWWEMAKLLWRYGLAPIRIQSLMKNTVNKFLEMYKPPYFPFSSLSSAVQALDLLQATAVTGAQFLETNGISKSFSNEIIQSSTRVNYGQNLGLIHGLETMVCMATDGAVAIEDGNWRIFSGMLDSSRADIRLNSTVTAIEVNSDETLTLSYSINGSSISSSTFDDIVIAAPFQYSNIELSPSLESIPDKVPYVKLYVTLFASPHRISPQYFNLSKQKDVPDMILTTLPKGLDLGSREDGVGPTSFWSISLLRIVEAPAEGPHQQHYVYKVFSPERPTAGFLASVLGVEIPEANQNGTIGDISRKDVSWVHEKTWHPYPYEYPRVTFEKIRLASNIWYTGGIESFISTMETSSLMGMNVAGLMTNEWQDKLQLGKPVNWSGWAGQRNREL
ncbi:prenylcysteine lyase, putative [Talaromyces stipitatus ATCC 10500]|uniref:Prenylcysteine lyase, putative n=1 Tax=Talaromyces stipitatus (strain ATCC 10500 / CBS 375.48 / QM 6759 / NRRL 1006) TaxID=441959 RepID=B8M703_TALSN|nr:prenylcysteine lyase, putative [Talaromyces stipitatus ATCC 10500]EED20223.1 prenylcysteine lyase, putative [Talaromyces stipitatus ATCC 10500]